MAITKATKSGFTRDTQQKYDDFLAGNKGYNPYFWAGYLDTGANAYAGRIVADSSSNVYLPGSFVESSFNVGFLAKLTSALTNTFQRQLTRASNSLYFTSSALESGGANLYCSFYPGPSLGIIKYDSSGTIQWQYSFRDPNTTNDSSTTKDIAIDSTNNVYCCGYGDGFNWNRGMLVKVNSSGTFQWGVEVGSAGSFLEAVEVDSSDNVYIAGLSDAGTQGAFIQKLNSAGTSQWKKRLTPTGGVSNYIYWYGMNVNNANSTLVVQGNNSLTGQWTIAQYDLAGNLNWQRNWTAPNGDGSAITHDSSNNIYLSQGRNILKLDSSGTILWQREFIPTSGSLNISDIKIINNLMYVAAVARSGQNQLIMVGQFPTDGGTGVNPYYINANFSFTYQASNYTMTTPTYTADNNTSSVTGPSYTRTTTSYTGSTPTFTYIKST